MAKYEAGAVYVPWLVREGRPVAAPDEDAFTMAVAALESMDEGGSGPLGAIHWVGAPDPTVDWALPTYLGTPVPVEHHSATAEGWRGAVRAAEELGDGVRALALLVDRDGPDGAQALVASFGPRASRRVPEWAEHGDSAARVARAGLVAAGAGPPPPALGRAPPDAERAAAFFGLAPTHVSEGAYVPRPRYLENLPSRWRLEADRCGHCGRVTFPRRGRCRACGRSDRLEVLRLPRDGAPVVATTSIGKGGQPTEFDDQVEALGGYEVVLAEFAPGVRLTLQVADVPPGTVRIGDRVDTQLRRLYPMDGEWRYGRKAVPVIT